MIWASVMPDRILTIFLTSFWPTIGWTSSLLMRTFKEPEEDGMIWASVMPDRILTIFLSEPETVLVVTAIGWADLGVSDARQDLDNLPLRARNSPGGDSHWVG